MLPNRGEEEAKCRRKPNAYPRFQTYALACPYEPLRSTLLEARQVLPVGLADLIALVGFLRDPGVNMFLTLLLVPDLFPDLAELGVPWAISLK
jgi:hypothetical protein